MKHCDVFLRDDMSALYSWMNDILLIIIIITYSWVLVLQGVHTQARLLHEDFAFAPVVWLLCANSSGVIDQLNSLSGHKNHFCVGIVSDSRWESVVQFTGWPCYDGCISPHPDSFPPKEQDWAQIFCLTKVLTQIRQMALDPDFSFSFEWMLVSQY